MFRRVETCFPIQKKAIYNRILKDLEYYLTDNTQAWELQSDGSYIRHVLGENEEPHSAQQALLDEYAERV